MLLIPCPYCGPRAQSEFSYGSDASVLHPEWQADAAADTSPARTHDTAQQAAQGLESDELSTQGWLDYIYLRDNPLGPHLEWWQHSSGCRAWIKVRRDTATHQILGAWRADEAVASMPCTEQSSGEDGS